MTERWFSRPAAGSGFRGRRGSVVDVGELVEEN